MPCSRFLSLLSVLVAWCGLLRATPAATPAEPRHEIGFPNLPGYVTLACDFHTHTVFSDGKVWPSVRVDEAWREGLDVLAITDHIEYQPHRHDLPTQLNRSYVLAKQAADERDLLLVRGAEISRDTPPGHFNAIFVKDIQPLDTKDLLDAVKAATDQGGFVFWNHHAWQGPERGQWLDVHTKMFDAKWLHGLEICNGDEYYPQAHQWCLDKKLTMLGNSDIHEPQLRRASTAADHRTLTLVFARQRTLDGVREALREGRTAVWYKDRLIGREEWLAQVFAAAVEVSPPHLRTGKAVHALVRNRSPLDIRLELDAGGQRKALLLPARATTLLTLSGRDVRAARLTGVAANFWIAPEKPMPVTLEIPGEAEAAEKGRR